MKFNRNLKSEEEVPDPSEALPELLEKFDGCIVAGYRKGTREKHVLLVAGDDPCRDGLSFFIPAIEAWMQIGKTNEDDL